MKIVVYAPSFADHTAVDDDGHLHLPEGSRVRDAFKALRIPRIYAPAVMPWLNYDRAKLSAPLSDGDELSFLFVAGGG